MFGKRIKSEKESEKKMILQFFSIMRKRTFSIIVSGVIFALAFMAFQYITLSSYTIAPTGDIVIAKTLKVDDYQDRHDVLQYGKLFTSTGFLYSFYGLSKNNFDYNKLAPGWNYKSDNQKLEWLQKHITVTYFGAGRMEFMLNIQKSEPMDLEYLRANGDNYLTNFIEFANNKDSVGNYEIINSVVSIPNKLVTNRKMVILKYGIIGFIFGTVGISAIILALNMHKRKYGGA